MEGQPRAYAIADEDLDRENEEKTSAVRIELTDDMKNTLKGGAQMMIGCDHQNHPALVDELAGETLASLVQDLR